MFFTSTCCFELNALWLFQLDEEILLIYDGGELYCLHTVKNSVPVGYCNLVSQLAPFSQNLILQALIKPLLEPQRTFSSPAAGDCFFRFGESNEYYDKENHETSAGWSSMWVLFTREALYWNWCCKFRDEKFWILF